MVRVGGPPQLFGVPVGLDAATAIEKLEAVLGPPDEDTGWQDNPCPGHRPFRGLRWGTLGAYMERGERDTFAYWIYTRPANGVDPFDGRIVFPDGVKFGQTIASVAARLGLPIGRADVVNLSKAHDKAGRDFVGYAQLASEAVFTSYAEPVQYICE